MVTGHVSRAVLEVLVEEKGFLLGLPGQVRFGYKRVGKWQRLGKREVKDLLRPE